MVGVGYIFGCLISILLWKIDKQLWFVYIHRWCNRHLKSKSHIQILYVLVIFVSWYFLDKVGKSEIYNAITAFLVIDISNTERKNLKLKERIHFYDSISTISRATVCGFVAPLLYILLLGNAFALVYMIIYNIKLTYESMKIFKYTFIIFSIIPCIVSQTFLYIIYMLRNKRLSVNFRGDYIENCIYRPLLNIDILAAYVESVNFYYYYNDRRTHYLKSYGDYTNKIDTACINDYLSVAYGICTFSFIIFLSIEIYMKFN